MSGFVGVVATTPAARDDRDRVARHLEGLSTAFARLRGTTPTPVTPTGPTGPADSADSECPRGEHATAVACSRLGHARSAPHRARFRPLVTIGRKPERPPGQRFR